MGKTETPPAVPETPAPAPTEAPPKAPEPAPAPPPPTPAPTEVPPKAPEPAPPPDSSADIAALRAEIAALKSAQAEAATRAEKAEAAAKEAARLNALNALAGGISKPEYAALAPKVDASTEAGQAELRKWAAEHPELFRTQAPAPTPTPARRGMFKTLGEIYSEKGIWDRQ